MLADREIFYAYCGNTAVNHDPLPVIRARLTVVEQALCEWDVFEMAPPIQSPAKCDVRSVIRFLNETAERTGRRWVSGLHCDWRWSIGFSPHSWIQASWENFDDDDEVQEEVMTLFKEQAADFYDSGIQKLVPILNKCLDHAGDCVEK